MFCSPLEVLLKRKISGPNATVEHRKSRRGALGLKEQYDAAVAAGELLELLESLPRGTVEASIRLMRGYTRTGEWPEPILPSPAPERGRSPRSPSDEWSDE